MYCNLPVFELVLGPLHDEESRQYVDEHPPHPGRHFVCLGRPEVDVEHQNRHTYTAAATHARRGREKEGGFSDDSAR